MDSDPDFIGTDALSKDEDGLETGEETEEDDPRSAQWAAYRAARRAWRGTTCSLCLCP